MQIEWIVDTNTVIMETDGVPPAVGAIVVAYDYKGGAGKYRRQYRVTSIYHVIAKNGSDPDQQTHRVEVYLKEENE